jgi:hypothetical protein
MAARAATRRPCCGRLEGSPGPFRAWEVPSIGWRLVRKLGRLRRSGLKRLCSVIRQTFVIGRAVAQISSLRLEPGEEAGRTAPSPWRCATLPGAAFTGSLQAPRYAG